jgi:hypothetical protein
MAKHLFAIEANESKWDLPASQWPTDGDRPHVFIQHYDLPANSDSLPEALRALAGTRLYLFGQRVLCSHLPTDPDSFSIEYLVLEVRPGTGRPIAHSLQQSTSSGDIFFATDVEHARPVRKRQMKNDPPEEGFTFRADVGGATHKQFKVFVLNEAYVARIFDDYVQAGRQKSKGKWLAERIRPDFQHLGRMPRWAEGEGDWPFVDGHPMLFLAQTMIPRNATNETHLTFDAMLYLFVGLRGDSTVCKLCVQSVGIQTAEAHYRLEELMDLYNARPRDPKVVHKVVTEGDRFFHEHLLNDPNLPAATLTLLAKHAANKELRTRAAQRLRKMTA